jgi:hypothetical protein
VGGGCDGGAGGAGFGEEVVGRVAADGRPRPCSRRARRSCHGKSKNSAFRGWPSLAPSPQNSDREPRRVRRRVGSSAARLAE